MIEITQFNENDLYEMFPRMWPAEREDFIRNYGDHESALIMAGKGIKMAGPAVTLKVDGVNSASFGVAIQPGGRGIAWLFFTPDVRPHKAEFEKTVNMFLKSTIAIWSLKSVMTAVISGYEQKMPWVRRLGFEEIGRDMAGKTEAVFYEYRN